MQQPTSSDHRAASHRPWAPVMVTVLAIAIFSLMDALMKDASQQLGAPTAAFWRSFFCVLISAVMFVVVRGKSPPRSTWLLHSSRAFVSSLLVLLFFYGITKVPLAEGIAITFIAPLIAIYLASIFLHEKMQRLAVMGSVLGFGGVIVIVAGRASGAALSHEIWLGIAALLAAALLYAINIVLMRKQASIATPVEVVFFQSVLVLIFLGVPAPFYATMPNLPQFLLLIASAFCTVASLTLLSWAYARAQTQHLVPVEYTAFIWASIFGYLMFGEMITLTVIFGTVLIVAGCLIATWKRG